MITSILEYEKAQAELRDLESRLAGIQAKHPIGDKGFTKAGIRKLIARLKEELALFEGSEETRSTLREGQLMEKNFDTLVVLKTGRRIKVHHANYEHLTWRTTSQF